MKFSFETTTELSPNNIWPIYENIENWYSWEDDLESISLNGNFETGTTGEMTLKNQPPMPFELVEVIQNKCFCDKTVIQNVGEIYFNHELILSEGKTVIRHSVEFVRFNNVDKRSDLELVSQIFSDVPKSVFALIEEAK
jgi:hypothetical protein